jgi:hypothetical protein
MRILPRGQEEGTVLRGRALGGSDTFGHAPSGRSEDVDANSHHPIPIIAPTAQS